jgi:hypothetical protein
LTELTANDMVNESMTSNLFYFVKSSSHVKTGYNDEPCFLFQQKF